MPSTLALVGHSRGGGTAVLQTARDSRVRTLVTWAAISSVERWPEDQRSAWRARGRTEIRNARTGQILPLYTDVLDDIEQNAETLDIEAAAARIRVPWLIIHGTEDESVRFNEARVLAAASRLQEDQIAGCRARRPYLRGNAPVALSHVPSWIPSLTPRSSGWRPISSRSPCPLR